MPDAFEGSPWNSKSTEDWNRPAYWLRYYGELLAEADPRRRENVVHRQVEPLLRMLDQAGELPLSSPRTLLDAGCGISLIPHLLAFWGFRVTAIDSCPLAIEVASRHRPTEEELALCIPIWEPCKEDPDSFRVVEDPARSLRRLRGFHAPGGSVAHVAGDWFAAGLPSGRFEVIHCRNSLRCSTKQYWRKSLRRFHELLSPGGMLLLENVNAVGILKEVQVLLAECGFTPFELRAVRQPAFKYVTAIWPTG